MIFVSLSCFPLLVLLCDSWTYVSKEGILMLSYVVVVTKIIIIIISDTHPNPFLWPCQAGTRAPVMFGEIEPHSCPSRSSQVRFRQFACSRR
ncbi:hypothetical protein BJX61DRAFT_423882 [Aspergillus egyptiacus]|nr:hypothetical protein BJX61DRAFT_423882 [Aspergillus egyptiacus]